MKRYYESEEHLQHLENRLQVLTLQKLSQLRQSQNPKQFQLLENTSVVITHGSIRKDLADLRYRDRRYHIYVEVIRFQIVLRDQLRRNNLVQPVVVVTRPEIHDDVKSEERQHQVIEPDIDVVAARLLEFKGDVNRAQERCVQNQDSHQYVPPGFEPCLTRDYQQRVYELLILVSDSLFLRDSLPLRIELFLRPSLLVPIQLVQISLTLPLLLEEAFPQRRSHR